MSKILDTNNLLDAAYQVLPASEFNNLREKAEAAAQKLADALAQHYGITCTDVSYQSGFAGLCATFAPVFDGQPCPPEIHDGDPGGEWEEQP